MVLVRGALGRGRRGVRGSALCERGTEVAAKAGVADGHSRLPRRLHGGISPCRAVVQRALLTLPRRAPGRQVGCHCVQSRYPGRRYGLGGCRRRGGGRGCHRARALARLPPSRDRPSAVLVVLVAAEFGDEVVQGVLRGQQGVLLRERRADRGLRSGDLLALTLDDGLLLRRELVQAGRAGSPAGSPGRCRRGACGGPAGRLRRAGLASRRTMLSSRPSWARSAASWKPPIVPTVLVWQVSGRGRVRGRRGGA